MDTVKLFIADTDETFIADVERAAKRHGKMEVVGGASDGVRALHEIRRTKPDALITDVQLPRLDGISMLREALSDQDPRVGIVCSRFCTDATLSAAQRCGASYFLCKPLEYSRLPEIIIDCLEEKRSALAKSDAAERVDGRAVALACREMLMHMGIPSKLLASVYLIEMMQMLRENPALLHNLSRGLYAQIAESMHTRPACVERALRSAISLAYARGNLREYFNYRPSNKEFIERFYQDTLLA